MKRSQNILKDKGLKVDINLVKGLKEINNSLWEIEDKIRLKEDKQEFDKDFVLLARLVYKTNDKRASFKKKINLKYNSLIVEEKSYSKY